MRKESVENVRVNVEDKTLFSEEAIMVNVEDKNNGK